MAEFDENDPHESPKAHFFYRYVLRGGFLEERAAFIFHFLHALWYLMLIDVKYLELKMQGRLEGHVSS